MDMKEASAMTEVSGLTDNEDELEEPSRTTRASRNEMPHEQSELAHKHTTTAHTHFHK